MYQHASDHGGLGKVSSMRIVEKHSHLNGEAFLCVHYPEILEEVERVIESVDVDECWDATTYSNNTLGPGTFSAENVAKAFDDKLKDLRWCSQASNFWVTRDAEQTRAVARMPVEMQCRAIRLQMAEPIPARLEINYVKSRAAVQVQLGKPSMVAHDLFVTYMNFYVSSLIDVGIEIVPMREFERQISTNVPYYERDVLNVIRQGRGVPAVPLVLIGIAP